MFRFTIRDVLLLTVIAAIAVAWGIDRYRFSKWLAEFEAIQQMRRAEIEEARAQAALHRAMEFHLSAKLQQIDADHAGK
jgi:hypothetical protein